MPADQQDPFAARTAAALLGRAAAADDARRLRAAMRDLFEEEGDRLDERLRAEVRRRIANVVAPIERDLRLGAARRLAEMQATEAAGRLLDDPVPAIRQLAAMAPAIRDPLVAELVGGAALDMLAAALPLTAPGGERPSLLVRLAECPEADVAATAGALLALPDARSVNFVPVLPETLRSRIVWWCAAVLRERLEAERRADHALVEAAEEVIADPTGAAQPEDAAMRLAAAIRARADELPGLLVETLGDRRPELFVAVLARASGLEYSMVRSILVDPAEERLLLLLRAQDIDRTMIARIGVALADADPRRGLDTLADALDAAMAVSAEEAAAFFVAWTLPLPYRDALRALAAAR